ncbi:MAG: hypothetical protein ABGY09_01200 [Euryarchaeota archaeon]
MAGFQVFKRTGRGTKLDLVTLLPALAFVAIVLPVLKMLLPSSVTLPLLIPHQWLNQLERSVTSLIPPPLGDAVKQVIDALPTLSAAIVLAKWSLMLLALLPLHLL